MDVRNIETVVPIYVSSSNVVSQVKTTPFLQTLISHSNIVAVDFLKF